MHLSREGKGSSQSWMSGGQRNRPGHLLSPSEPGQGLPTWPRPHRVGHTPQPSPEKHHCPHTISSSGTCGVSLWRNMTEFWTDFSMPCLFSFFFFFESVPPKTTHPVTQVRTTARSGFSGIQNHMRFPPALQLKIEYSLSFHLKSHFEELQRGTATHQEPDTSTCATRGLRCHSCVQTWHFHGKMLNLIQPMQNQQQL